MYLFVEKLGRLCSKYFTYLKYFIYDLGQSFTNKQLTAIFFSFLPIRLFFHSTHNILILMRYDLTYSN